MTRLKFAWGIYWRFLVVLFLLLLLLGYLQGQFNWLSIVKYSGFQPSLFWCSIAGIWAIASGLIPNGLMHVIWGYRIGLNQATWQTLNRATVALFALLSVIAICAYLSLSAGDWANYKLWGQPLILFGAPAIYVWFFIRVGTVDGGKP